MIVKETYPATVHAIDDPLQRGRIKVACSALLGDEETVLPQWIEPDYEWGWFIVPDVGEIVDVTCAVGADDDEQRGQVSIGNHDLRWRGRYWGGSETDVARTVPDDFKTNYGKRRGFATPGGHVLMFDDTKGSKKVSLTWAGDKDKNEFAYMAFDEDGSWVCGNKKGSLIYLNAKGAEASIVDESGNVFSMAATGIKMVDKTGNMIETKNGAIQVLGQGGVTISCKDAVIDAGNILLTQTAVDGIIKGTSFMTYFLAHTHPTGTGPSGPPVPTGTEATLVSTKAKVG